jgi:hypothetical protein
VQELERPEDIYALGQGAPEHEAVASEEMRLYEFMAELHLDIVCRIELPKIYGNNRQRKAVLD